jgi:DNA-binding response OmpR family regulator
MKQNNLIVVIEDDPDDHEIFLMAISEINLPIKCLFFFDCENALRHFQQGNADIPQLVLIDINLPSINGPECVLELQKLPGFARPYIVIHSTSFPVGWEDRLKAIGVDRLIEKSSSIPLLVANIEQLLRESAR